MWRGSVCGSDIEKQIRTFITDKLHPQLTHLAGPAGHWRIWQSQLCRLRTGTVASGNACPTIDATIDGNRTLGGSNTVSDVVNPAQPVASGGQLGQDGTLFEDFNAVTLGMAWRKDRWSATGRAEYRNGEFADRKGLTLGAIRQLGEGSIVGSGFTWTEAKADNGAATQIMDAAIAIAHRLSTLRDARRLVVLDQGRVVEVGTHEELIAKRGHFHHLVHLQQVTSEIIAVSGK